MKDCREKEISVLVISFSPLASDPRVSRQLDYLLSKGYKVYAIGESTPLQKMVEFLLVPRPQKSFIQKGKTALRLLSGFFEKEYLSSPRIQTCLQWMKNKSFDLIIANDIDALPLAAQGAEGASIIFDAHEYAPGEFDNSLRWRLVYQNYRYHLCAKYLPKTDAMITVCGGIANLYQQTFGITPEVITNAPYYQNLTPKKSIPSNPIKMIYHGCANPNRTIEDVIQAIDLIDIRFLLDIILIPGNERYIRKLKNLARHNPRIRFLPRVPFEEIPSFCNGYDVGVFPLRANGTNCLHALPNKLFEFIQARLAIVISPLPEMKKIVFSYNCGIVAENVGPQALADALMTLNHEKIWRFKQNSHKAAKKLCAEENLKVFHNLVKKTLGERQ